MSRSDLRALLRTKPGDLWGVPRPARVARSPFLRAMRAAAVRYLCRVDALPRDHVVWEYHSLRTVNFHRAAELAMRDLRVDPRNPDAMMLNLALDFSRGADGSLTEVWEGVSRAAGFDFRWAFYYAFRDWVCFEYDRVAEWRDWLLSVAGEARIAAFLHAPASVDDPEFRAVLESATADDIQAFLRYAAASFGHPAPPARDFFRFE